MSKRPSDSAAQPASRGGGQRVVGGSRQENLAGMGDGHQTSGPGQRRPDRLVVADLEIAEVDSHPRSLVDDSPSGAHGVDRLGEHDVARGAFRRQLDPSIPVGSRRPAPTRGGRRPISRSAGSCQPASSMSATSTARRCTVGPTAMRSSRSWARMRRSSSCRSGEGSIPRPSTSDSLVRPNARSASACRPERYRASMCKRPKALAERMLDRQRIQLGDHLAVPPSPHVRLDPGLERGQAELAEAGDLTVEKPVGLDIGVRMAPPHRQRLPQPRGRRVGVLGRHRRPVGVLERSGIDRRRRAIQTVGRPPDARSRRRAHGAGSTRTCGASPGCSAKHPLRRAPAAASSTATRPTGRCHQDRDDRPLLRAAQRSGYAVE